jgi:carboxypeptidase Taq
LARGAVRVFPDLHLGQCLCGCLHAALRADLPALDDDLARGDPSGALGWLKTRVQTHGGLRPPRETIEHAIGGPVSEAPLLDYLEAKFGALYGL